MPFLFQVEAQHPRLQPPRDKVQDQMGQRTGAAAGQRKRATKGKCEDLL